MHQRHEKRGQMRLLQAKIEHFFAGHVFVLAGVSGCDWNAVAQPRQANENAGLREETGVAAASF
jgi:hypothetical protein